MSLINIKNLTFCYDGSYDNIFENVSFQIDTDWKLGFTGRNGRGKTTFLKLLLGKYEHRGCIEKNVHCDYFPFPVADKTFNTIDILSGIASEAAAWEVLRELNRLEVVEDVLFRPFETLSSGEQTKVLLAALFLKANNFLLIDEPTNHLDSEARATVGRYLDSKRGFILISHDRSFLDSCIDHILSINKTNIEVQKGNFSSWWHNKELQDSFEQAENDRLQKDIKRLECSARRSARWSDRAESSKIGEHVGDRGYVGHKAAKMMKRAKNIESRQKAVLQDKEKLLKNIERADELKLSPLSHHARCLAKLEKVQVYYAGKPASPEVSFTIKEGDRVALCGKNGSGKSSLLKLVRGESMATSGYFHKAGGMIVSYVPQDTSFLRGSLSGYAEACQIDGSLFKTILRKLDLSRLQFEKDMADFSGGQKKKVLIARSLCEKAHLYIWDEPLNYIDVLSRIQLEELLLAYRPTLLFVEHDGAFVQNIATKKVLLQ